MRLGCPGVGGAHSHFGGSRSRRRPKQGSPGARRREGARLGACRCRAGRGQARGSDRDSPVTLSRPAVTLTCVHLSHMAAGFGGTVGGAACSAAPRERPGLGEAPRAPRGVPGKEWGADPGPTLTQHVGGAVPGHEARVVPVARALLEEALTEVLAEAAAGRHQPVVPAAAASSAAAARPGVGLREAAEHSAGHQPPVREDREHRRRRPPEEAGARESRRRTPRPRAGSLLSRSRAASRALLRAARSGRRRPCPTRGASHTLSRTHRSQSEVRADGSSASARLRSRVQPPPPPPSSAPLACSGPRRQRRPPPGHAPATPTIRRPGSCPAPRPDWLPYVVTVIEHVLRTQARWLLGVVVPKEFCTCSSLSYLRS